MNIENRGKYCSSFGFLGALSLVFLGLGATWLLEPPSPVTSSAPPEVFSSSRAMAHVRSVAREPHSTPSEALTLVREYLLAELRSLGLEPLVEERVLEPTGTPLHNISARVPGQASTGTVVLAAHYDSRPSSPGAADDAAGVGAILETLRALKTSRPLRNDILVLFTDGEERGMLGSRAFVQHCELPTGKAPRLSERCLRLRSQLLADSSSDRPCTTSGSPWRSMSPSRSWRQRPLRLSGPRQRLG